MANVFYLAGFIEAWGRGYEKIREAFEKEKLEIPVFEEVRGGMMATIKREKFMAIQAKGAHLLCGFLQFLHQGHHSAQKILVLWHKRLYDAAEPIAEGLKVGEGKRLIYSLVHPA